MSALLRELRPGFEDLTVEGDDGAVVAFDVGEGSEPSIFGSKIQSE